MSIRKRINYESAYGLTEVELNRLSRYHSENARGLVHTPEWEQQMAELKRRFDAATVGESFQ